MVSKLSVVVCLSSRVFELAGEAEIGDAIGGRWACGWRVGAAVRVLVGVGPACRYGGSRVRAVVLITPAL